MDPFSSTTELSRRIRHGDVSPLDAVETYLDRIDDLNDPLTAYVTVTGDSAREAAEDAADAVAAADHPDALPSLHGVPVAIKDLYAYKSGVRNTYGSVVFENHVPETDALVVQRLESAGAIVLGKTNTPEFGHKGITENRLFGPTKTPFDTSYNAGGSSGGSAAAVAAGLASFAQGSDGGGSIRIPAAACGVYGFKPSYGRVPYEGRPDAFSAHTPMALAGPITRTVADAALVLESIVGPHPRDPMSAPDDDLDYVTAADRDVDGMRIAYSPDLDIFPVEDEVAEIVEDAVDSFEDAGASVDEVDVDLRHDRETITEAWRAVSKVKYRALVENLRDEGTDLLGEHRDDVADTIVQLAEAGADVSGVEYKRTDNVRTDVFDGIQDVFEEYDIVVSPTLATARLPNEGDGPEEIGGEPIDSLLDWFLTWPYNLTGHPAASIPAGRTADGLPVGMQIAGRRWADDDVLAASGAFERVSPWHDWYDELP